MTAGDIKHNQQFASVIELANGAFARLVSFTGMDSLGEVDDSGHLKVVSGQAVKTATILGGGEYSTEIDLEGFKEMAIAMPASWKTATLSVLAASATGGTFNPVYDSDGTKLTLSVDANRVISLTAAEASLLKALRFIKFQASVTQPATRVLTILLK